MDLSIGIPKKEDNEKAEHCCENTHEKKVKIEKNDGYGTPDERER